MHLSSAVICTLLLLSNAPKLAAQNAVPDIQIVKGACDASSHTAEGPIDSDLSKRESRFFCDSAIFSFFDDYKGHVLVQFSQSQARHAPLLGFAGRAENGMVQVEKVYLSAGEPLVVSDGVCKLFSKNGEIAAITCGKLDETGRRTVAVVVFNASPGQ